MRRLLCLTFLLTLFAACDRPKPGGAPPPSAATSPAPPTEPRQPSTPTATAAPAPTRKPEATPASARDARSPEDAPLSITEGMATWYDAPKSSLPKRRAPGEFTAAYDRFPVGTRVRVTNKASGRKVVVCITDDGVGKRKTIDLCKEAAEELGMLAKGEVKVLIEELEKR